MPNNDAIAVIVSLLEESMEHLEWQGLTKGLFFIELLRILLEHGLL